jgi:hypothetical protein
VLVVGVPGGGGVVGEALGGVLLVAATVTASFIPPAQWPEVGHMKYIVPAVVRLTVVGPFWWEVMGLAVLQAV